jgi:prepilin-type N-terminal cleavage/methylation domain-containing protein
MRKNAFTLIEIMVAVGIFAILLTTFTGFFVGAVQSQRKTLASQELIDNVSYNLEYMSRTIRMARKDLVGDCISIKNNYETNPERNRIRFLNYQGECQEFFWNDNDNRLYELKNGETALPLTPANLEVVSFVLSGSESWGQDQEPLTQPKVTLFLEVKGKGQKPELQPLIKIQTTISQRNLNVRY